MLRRLVWPERRLLCRAEAMPGRGCPVVAGPCIQGWECGHPAGWSLGRYLMWLLLEGVMSDGDRTQKGVTCPSREKGEGPSLSHLPFRHLLH